eukprot:1153745-Pelagomonas_calceolata.AAC.1
MSPMVKIKGCETIAGLHTVVVGKLSSNQVLIPVRLIWRNVSSEHVFHSAVCSLSLPVSLRVV